ncbi:hypothetical protein FVER14953_21757 [Fusarium verticillioides]|nr:hypothetical protein FVER14953_21757 [Fusarium verticillioides]
MDEGLSSYSPQTAVVKVEPVMFGRDVLCRKDSFKKRTKTLICSAGAGKDMRKAVVQESTLDVFEIMAKLLQREPQFLVAIHANHAFNSFFIFWSFARHDLLDTPQDWMSIGPFWFPNTFIDDLQTFPAYRRNEAPRFYPDICAFIVGKRDLKKAGLFQKKTILELIAEKNDL